MCLLIEICSASYFPYQPRCNHPQVTASISFPEKETATGNGESSSERQHLYSGCSFRIPTSLPAPFLCSKTLQRTPQLRVHLFPPDRTAANPAVMLEESSSFKACPVSPVLPDRHTYGRRREAARRVSGREAERFPLACAQGGGFVSPGFSLRYKIVKDHSLPCLFKFFFPLRDGQN